jgi:class 3 adenylate cyclase
VSRWHQPQDGQRPRSNILGKLGVDNRVEAAVAAARLGLAPIEAGPTRRGRPIGDAGGRRQGAADLPRVGHRGLDRPARCDGDAAWRDLRRWHDQTLRALFERHGGREVDHAGDGFLVAFEAAADAVACAVAIQRTLADHRRTAGFAPSVRIGLHTGEAELDGPAYAGAAVHAAARIAARADGGQILASGPTLRAGRVAPAAPHQRVSLKGLSEPVEVAAVAW